MAHAHFLRGPPPRSLSPKKTPPPPPPPPPVPATLTAIYDFIGIGVPAIKEIWPRFKKTNSRRSEKKSIYSTAQIFFNSSSSSSLLLISLALSPSLFMSPLSHSGFPRARMNVHRETGMTRKRRGGNQCLSV